MDDAVAIHLTRQESDETKKIKLKHKLAIEDMKYDNEWKSCCLRMDKRAVRFFTQLCISLGVIALCIAQLLRLKDCGNQHAYIGLLTLIIGVWLPSPSMNK